MLNNNIKIFDKLISKTKVYLVIIAILLVIICIYEHAYIIPAIIGYFLIVIYAYWTNNKKKEELSEHIRDLTFTADNVAKGTLINSPFPLVVMETDGKIIWKSKKFIDEFTNTDINTYLKEVVKEIKLEIENGNIEKNVIDKKIEVANKKYRLLGQFIKSKMRDKKNKKEYVTTLYFIDETESVDLMKKYEESQMSVGIVMVDNYEEIIQRISTEDRPQVMALIEKSIYEWASKYEGLVIKSDRDTFVCMFEQKYLDEIQESKFNILDTIKEISIPGKIQSTLSIAISTEGNSNYQKYKSAVAAIDIALGRGGDQAILRRNGKYVFFGGRAQELEKRTKVKARIVAHALEELIQESENVMIMGHSNSDIDSLGSSFGIYRMVKSLGKTPYIVVQNYGIGIQSFINTVKTEKEYEEAIIDKDEALDKATKNTLLIVVDTHKKSYVEVPELLNEINKVVVIDHHRRSTDYIQNATLTFHEVYASSASELVTELLEYAEKNIELKQLESEALYAGIMMDTKNFTFKTGVRTFEAAAYLRKTGIDIIKIKKWFQSDLETYKTISKIVNKAEITNETIAISMYEEEDKNANIICAKAADELLTISDVTASFVIGNLGEKICISGRSIGDVNVQVILEKLGGGGHMTLAGAQVEGMNIFEVKDELIIRINEYFLEIVG